MVADLLYLSRSDLVGLGIAMPEVIAVEVVDGHLEYLGWLRHAVRLER